MMEARLMLACIAQRHRLSLPPGATVRAEQLFTIRPKGGLKMDVADYSAAMPAASARAS